MIVLPVPVISGHPAKEANTEGYVTMVTAMQSSIADIDQLPMATAKGLTKRSNRPQGCIGARRPFAQAAAGGQGRLLGEATLTDGSARGLQDELCARATSPGPVAAERRDGDDHQ